MDIDSIQSIHDIHETIEIRHYIVVRADAKVVFDGISQTAEPAHVHGCVDPVHAVIRDVNIQIAREGTPHPLSLPMG